MTQHDFDNACLLFTQTMRCIASWKHTYAGAAYSTRLRSAIKDARIACDQLEASLNADAGDIGRRPMTPIEYVLLGAMAAWTPSLLWLAWMLRKQPRHPSDRWERLMLPFRVLFYNHVKRHWHNWRFNRMWRAEGRSRPAPQAGAISQECLDWATRAAKEHEEYEKANPDWRDKCKTWEEFKREREQRADRP